MSLDSLPKITILSSITHPQICLNVFVLFNTREDILNIVGSLNSSGTPFTSIVVVFSYYGHSARELGYEHSSKYFVHSIISGRTTKTGLGQ